MTSLTQLVNTLDEILQTHQTPDYPNAYNGLQVEGKQEIKKIGSAVDASFNTIQQAVDSNVDLLIVHHGLFWQGVELLTKTHYKKMKLALDAGMAIYSAHIPLDCHPLHGNNILLAQKIGLQNTETFFDWKGIHLGVKQFAETSFTELLERVEIATGFKPHFCPGFSKEEVGTIGIITGGAGSEVSSIARSGINTFITGEGPHWSYILAEELNVNVIYGGHYATETFGVRSISEFLAKRNNLESCFIDLPTGL